MSSAGGHWPAQGRNWWYVSSEFCPQWGAPWGAFFPAPFEFTLPFLCTTLWWTPQFHTVLYFPVFSWEFFTFLKRTFLSWRMTSEVFINHLKPWLFCINLKISHLSERWYSQIASVERKGVVLCSLSPTIIDIRLSCHVIVLKAITLK